MSKNTMLLFPGQGSQNVGMGQALKDNFTAAKHVFDEVDDALDLKLSQIIFEGPEEQLTLTQNTQPALMAVSLAVMKVLEHDFACPITALASRAAGHSLGEYSAYTAAGTFSLADCARLLRIRGQAMQAAVPVGAGAMAAILGLDFERVQTLITDVQKQNAVCAIANDNSDGQVVISGDRHVVEQMAEQAKHAGAKRAVMLPVSAPFHCALMKPAADKMAEALSAVEIKMPSIPVMSNVTLISQTCPEDIKNTLVDQVTGVVRWRETMNNALSDNTQTFVEVGAGKVLTGLIRRSAKDATLVNLLTPEDIEAFAKSRAA